MMSFTFILWHQVSTKRVKASSNSGKEKKEEWEKEKNLETIHL
jgi:hypothetical protein